jgi:hypothetical protein
MKKRESLMCALAVGYIKNNIPTQHRLALMLQICTFFFVKAHASHHASTIHAHVVRAFRPKNGDQEAHFLFLLWGRGKGVRIVDIFVVFNVYHMVLTNFTMHSLLMMFSNVSPKLFLLAPHFIPYPLPKILLQN